VSPTFTLLFAKAGVVAAKVPTTKAAATKTATIPRVVWFMLFLEYFIRLQYI
jgi:hypothetical protein